MNNYQTKDENILRELVEEIRNLKNLKVNKERKSFSTFLSYLFGWTFSLFHFIFIFFAISLFNILFFAFFFTFFFGELNSEYRLSWTWDLEKEVAISFLVSSSLLFTSFFFYEKKRTKQLFEIIDRREESKEEEDSYNKMLSKFESLIENIGNRVEAVVATNSQAIDRAVVVNRFEHEEIERIKERVSKFERFVNSLRKSNMEIPPMSNRNGKSYNRWNAMKKNSVVIEDGNHQDENGSASDDSR